jgi:cell division protein FtsI/penicillin-binding protein 2
VRGLGAAIAGAVLLGALAMLLFLGPGGEAGQVYVPEGYVAQVQAWIADDLLSYDCAGRRVEVAELPPAAETFFAHSYLADDVAAFNAGDRRPFLVEHRELRGGGCDGRLTGVNASFHNQRLPTYVAETWEGSLLLRPSQGGSTLTSGRRTLEVLPVPWERLPLSSAAFDDVPLTRAAAVRSPRLALEMGGGRAFATLKRVGDEPVLEVLEETPSLFLDSCPVPLGWRLRLAGGDVVRVHQAGRLDERFLVESGARPGVVSFLTEVNGEPRRRSFPETLAMGDEIARAVDAVVADARRAAGGSRDDFDVHLTLDPFLHHRVDRAVGDFAERYGRRLPRAAVTVLDAASGRLLALGSHPGAEALERWEVAEDGTRRELLRRNHNFLQHPVGSAAKPFLAAAALATRPALAGLRVPCTPAAQPETLLGYDMGPYNLPGDCAGRGEDGTVDLGSFLEVSSNRYMLYLGLLAMAEWDASGPVDLRGAEPLPPGAGYTVAGRTHTLPPRLPIVRYEDDVPGDDLTPLQEVAQQTDLADRFEELFAQGARYRREGTIEGMDLELWQPVLRAAYGAGGGEEAPRRAAALGFSPVAPEEVNLRLNLAQHLRRDLYTVLLGNGDNRWSNVQLAEALARLVTGRRVEAQLVERVTVPVDGAGGDDGADAAAEVLWDAGARPAPPPLAGGLADEARQRILAGMRRAVTSPHGTASAVGRVLAQLNRRAPAGVEYRALGKTGTPTLPLEVVRRGPVEAAPDAVRTYSGNRQVVSGVLVLAVERWEDGVAEELVLAVFVDSQGGSEQAVALAAELLPSIVEARWPRDWLQAGR